MSTRAKCLINPLITILRINNIVSRRAQYATAYIHSRANSTPVNIVSVSATKETDAFDVAIFLTTRLEMCLAEIGSVEEVGGDGETGCCDIEANKVRGPPLGSHSLRDSLIALLSNARIRKRCTEDRNGYTKSQSCFAGWADNRSFDGKGETGRMRIDLGRANWYTLSAMLGNTYNEDEMDRAN